MWDAMRASVIESNLNEHYFTICITRGRTMSRERKKSKWNNLTDLIKVSYQKLWWHRKNNEQTEWELKCTHTYRQPTECECEYKCDCKTAYKYESIIHVHHTIYYTKIAVVRKKDHRTELCSLHLQWMSEKCFEYNFFKFIQIVKYFKRNFSLLCYIHWDLFLSLHIFFCFSLVRGSQYTICDFSLCHEKYS